MQRENFAFAFLANILWKQRQNTEHFVLCFEIK
jgi:hypothetical protein